MSELFEKYYTEFLDGSKKQQEEKIKKHTQTYFDKLAKLYKNGAGYFPDESDIDEVVYRDLTEEEKDELLYNIGIWLQSLN